MKKKILIKITGITIISLFFAFLLFVYAARYYNEKKNTDYISVANQTHLDGIGYHFGKTFPDIELLDTNGKKVKLRNFDGKIIYLDFWSSHCGPCVEQEPYWENVIKRFGQDRAIVFINVDIDKDFSTWKQEVRRKNKKGISLFFQSKTIDSGKQFGVVQYPTYFFLNTGRRIWGYDVRPGNIINKRSEILADWILTKIKEGTSAREAAVGYYANTREFASWSREYKSKNSDF